MEQKEIEKELVRDWFGVADCLGFEKEIAYKGLGILIWSKYISFDGTKKREGFFADVSNTRDLFIYKNIFWC